MTTLGVDPGSRAAGVVLLGSCGRTALGAWLLVYRGRKTPVWQVTSADGVTSEVLTLHDAASIVAAECMRREPIGRLVVEDLFVPRGRKLNPQTVLALAEACGELVGPLRSLCVEESPRPLASTWRPAVASIGRRTPAKEAAAMAVQRARVAFTGLGELLDGPHAEHVAEAAWIARWGWAQRSAA